MKNIDTSDVQDPTQPLSPENLKINIVDVSELVKAESKLEGNKAIQSERDQNKLKGVNTVFSGIGKIFGRRRNARERISGLKDIGTGTQEFAVNIVPNTKKVVKNIALYGPIRVFNEERKAQRAGKNIKESGDLYINRGLNDKSFSDNALKSVYERSVSQYDSETSLLNGNETINIENSHKKNIISLVESYVRGDFNDPNTGAFLEKSYEEAKKRVFSEIEGVEKRYALYEDNIRRIGEHIKAQADHQDALDRLKQSVQINFIKAKESVSVVGKEDKVEAIVNKIIRFSKGKGSLLVNETTVALAVAAALSVAGKAKESMLTPVLGFGAGFITGALREKAEFVRDVQIDNAEMAEGGSMDITGKERRAEISKGRVEMVDANGLISKLEKFVHYNDQGILEVEEGISSIDMQEALNALIEAKAREKIRLTDDRYKGKNLIRYSSGVEKEVERNQLDKLIPALHVHLRNLLDRDFRSIPIIEGISSSFKIDNLVDASDIQSFLETDAIKNEKDPSIRQSLVAAWLSQKRSDKGYTDQVCENAADKQNAYELWDWSRSEEILKDYSDKVRHVLINGSNDVNTYIKDAVVSKIEFLKSGGVERSGNVVEGLDKKSEILKKIQRNRMLKSALTAGFIGAAIGTTTQEIGAFFDSNKLGAVESLIKGGNKENALGYTPLAKFFFGGKNVASAKELLQQNFESHNAGGYIINSPQNVNILPNYDGSFTLIKDGKVINDHLSINIDPSTNQLTSESIQELSKYNLNMSLNGSIDGTKMENLIRLDEINSQNVNINNGIIHLPDSVYCKVLNNPDNNSENLVSLFDKNTNQPIAENLSFVNGQPTQQTLDLLKSKGIDFSQGTEKFSQSSYSAQNFEINSSGSHIVNVGSASVNIPNGMDIVKGDNDSYNIVRSDNNESVIRGIKFTDNGSLTEESKKILSDYGTKLSEKTETIASGTVTKTVSAQEFVSNPEHNKDFVNISRDGWLSKGGNSQRVYWGGESGSGIDANGNYVLDISKMAPNGSSNGSQSFNPIQLSKDGKMHLLVSVDDSTQTRVVDIPFNKDGKVIIDKDSTAGKLLFHKDASGKAVMDARFAEVAYFESDANGNPLLTSDGRQRVEIFATHVGKGLKQVSDNITSYKNQTNITIDNIATTTKTTSEVSVNKFTLNSITEETPGAKIPVIDIKENTQAPQATLEGLGNGIPTEVPIVVPYNLRSPLERLDDPNLNNTNNGNNTNANGNTANNGTTYNGNVNSNGFNTNSSNTNNGVNSSNNGSTSGNNAAGAGNASNVNFNNPTSNIYGNTYNTYTNNVYSENRTGVANAYEKAESKEDIGLIDWSKHREHMLKEFADNPDLDTYNDDLKLIDSYFNRQNPEYINELNNLVKDIEPMDSDIDLVISIPAYREGANLEKTISNYAKLNSKQKFELFIFENLPSNKERDNTAEVIQRMKEKYPELKIRHMYKMFDEKKPIGEIRKYMVDAILLRKKNSGINKSIAIASNDADLEDISPRYAEDLIKDFTNPKVDAVGAKWDYPKNSFQQFPLMHAAQRVWMIFDAMKRHQFDNRPDLIGRNSAFRAGTYAAIGGYNPKAKIAEDLEIGWLIGNGRNWQINRTIYDNRAWIKSNPRRAVGAMLSGIPLTGQYADFHENEKVRGLSLEELLKNKIDFDDKQFVKEVQSIFDFNYSYTKANGGWLDNLTFDKVFDRTMRHLGIEYKYNYIKNQENGTTKIEIEITNIDKLKQNLKNYSDDENINDDSSYQNTDNENNENNEEAGEHARDNNVPHNEKDNTDEDLNNNDQEEQKQTEDQDEINKKAEEERVRAQAEAERIRQVEEEKLRKEQEETVQKQREEAQRRREEARRAQEEAQRQAQEQERLRREAEAKKAEDEKRKAQEAANRAKNEAAGNGVLSPENVKTPDDLKSYYRNFIKKFHTDVANGNAEFNKQISQKINAAYEEIQKMNFGRIEYRRSIENRALAMYLYNSIADKKNGSNEQKLKAIDLIESSLLLQDNLTLIQKPEIINEVKTIVKTFVDTDLVILYLENLKRKYRL